MYLQWVAKLTYYTHFVFVSRIKSPNIDNTHITISPLK